MPRDEQAQMDAITSELIKDQGVADQLRDAINEMKPNLKVEEATPPIPPLFLTERESKLISNCTLYAANDPAGLPGHQLALLVDKLYGHIEQISDVEPVVSYS